MKGRSNGVEAYVLRNVNNLIVGFGADQNFVVFQLNMKKIKQIDCEIINSLLESPGI